LKKDLSRRDDLWSFYFVILDFLNVSLPWKAIQDKEEVADIKTKSLENAANISEKSIQDFISEIMEKVAKVAKTEKKFSKILHLADISLKMREFTLKCLRLEQKTRILLLLKRLAHVE
jgi:hypothetical protein